MDADDRDLVRQLMARATLMLEDAAAAAVTGQSEQMTAAQYLRLAQRLEVAVEEVALVTRVAAFLARPGARSSPQQSC